MRRFVGFSLGGMVASLLVSFLPPSASTITFAILVGVGGGGGSMAREPREVASLGAARSSERSWEAIQAFGSGCRGLGDHGSATVGLVVAAAGFVALVVSRARQPPPPRRR
jgi:hypothetical protein